MFYFFSRFPVVEDFEINVVMCLISNNFRYDKLLFHKTNLLYKEIKTYTKLIIIFLKTRAIENVHYNSEKIETVS